MAEYKAQNIELNKQILNYAQLTASQNEVIRNQEEKIKTDGFIISTQDSVIRSLEKDTKIQRRKTRVERGLFILGIIGGIYGGSRL